MDQSKNFIGHLLIVDDNKVNRLLLARTLEKLGHTMSFAENGRQALDMLHSQPFDLVILDVLMPELDGFQVLEQIVADPHLRSIPVVMASSSDELDTVVRCIEIGAEDYLHKPVNPVLLKARINASLEKKRLRDQQRDLIRKFATEEVADQLMQTGFELGGKSVEVSVLFSDIRSFTTITESQSPAETIELLNTYYALMFDAISSHGGVVNQMIGDGLMCVFGAPVPQADHCQRAVDAALEMVDLIEQFNQYQIAENKQPIKIGVGVATGQVIAGYTGTQQRATYTCVGDTVNLASRLETHTKVVGKSIVIDAVTRERLNDNITVVDEGMAQIKGKMQEVHIFSVNTN